MKRGIRVRVHFADLDTGLPQRIGTCRRNIQSRGCNGDWVLGVVHHISGRGTDFLIGIAAESQIRKDCFTIRTGSHISYLVASAVIEPVGHACQGFSGVGISLIDGQTALIFRHGGLDLDIGSHRIKPSAGVTRQGLILSGAVIPAQYGFVRVNAVCAASGGVGFLGRKALGRLRCGRDGQGIAALRKRNAVATIAGKVEVTQHTVGVGDAGTVVAAGILRQLNGVAPTGVCRRKAGNISCALHGIHNFTVPQGKRGIARRIDAGIEGTGSPRAVVVGASVLTNQVPNDCLRSGPLFGVHDVAAVAVTVCRAILCTGIAAGKRQRNAALNRRRQVVPTAAGALHGYHPSEHPAGCSRPLCH